MRQSLIIDLQGPTITLEEEHLLQHSCVAGVILFERNVENFDRHALCQLTQSIHQLRPDCIIITDHEGGFIQRFKRMGFRPLISAGAHGRLFDLHSEIAIKNAYDEGRAMAQDLLSCGIDLSLAPVLDLYHRDCKIIGGLDRAFHKEPEIIIKLARSYIAGMHAAKMPAVGKHFPGHGSCVGDSHLTLPINEKTFEELKNSDLKPFIALIKELDAVMPAHVLYPKVDPQNAVTYSQQWLYNILRNDLQFNGLVISDCLGMKGADIGNLAERAQQALQGCDLLIAANQDRAALTHLLNTLPEGTSNTRFERFKQKMARYQEPFRQDTQGIAMEEREYDPCNPTSTI